MAVPKAGVTERLQREEPICAHCGQARNLHRIIEWQHVCPTSVFKAVVESDAEGGS